MVIQKQSITINFSKGVDTKTDPFQLALGNFLHIENSIFGKAGGLVKRNGFGQLSALPSTDFTFLTSFSGNLTAIGNSLSAYSQPTNTWVTKGNIQPLSLDILPLIRNNVNQSQVDTAVSNNGFVCTVYTESDGSTTSYKYAIASVITGQNIISPTAIPISSGVVTGSPRVFLVNNKFIIVFTNVISAVSHLQFIAINTLDPTTVTANADIASSYIAKNTLSWDGVVVGTKLFIAYNTTTGGQSVKITYISSSLSVVASKTFSSQIATIMSMTVDNTNPASPIIYASYYDLAGTTGYTFAVDQNLNTVLAATQWLSSGTILNVTCAAQNGINTIYYEVSNAYSYDATIPTNFIQSKTVTVSGTVSSARTVIRSVGLASKAFIINGIEYFLSIQYSTYQPTYFLINGTSSLSSSPIIVAKLAYQNGGVYYTKGLPNVTINGNLAQIGYFFKDLIQAVNKNTLISSGTQTAGIYSQTGINLSSFIFSTAGLDSADIGGDLHLTGGYLTMYDGYLPVEHNFFLYPENSTVTDLNSMGGHLAALQYYYQVTYEWSDNQGNQFRSAPSIPFGVDASGTGTDTSMATLAIPTLRLTSKVSNPVKIVIYRWSSSQQNYYQVTSITQPTLNSTTTDSITFIDTLSDASILGNNLLYTTGGVLEDVNAPASNLLALFDNRLWLVDAEDKNLLWYSKQVIEATPVEMSDLLTLFVAPTTAAQGSTGPITALSAVDDKLIIFKRNAIYYLNGAGPDNTGSNNQYSQPTFITSTVGCENQNSIVFIPNGLMFQSDKGIWLLGRDLSTTYIGAPVEAYNDAHVESALTIPETNQVRFTLDNGITLMYDYYFQQWGTFINIPAVSSALFQNLHTYLDKFGRVFQETPDKYLDGSSPVLMSFVTGWLNVAGLRGYERAYEFNLLGTYLSPHKIQVQVAYDYKNPIQSEIYNPQNYGGNWGSGEFWGSGSWGGPSNIEDFRVHNKKQLCKSFQIQVQEIFDPSFGTIAGAGLTLSGICAVIGVKRGWAPTKGSNSIG